MLEKIININLMKNPVNWVIVALMVLFGLQLFAMLSPQPSKVEN